MSIKVDLDTATREELVAEIVRQDGMVSHWSACWKTIVHANAEAWEQKVKDAEEERDMLRRCIS